MKNVLFIILCLSFLGNQVSAQVFAEKGDLKVGIKVTKDGKTISIDSLCKGYDPITNIPIDLVVPEGSSVDFLRDSIKTENLALLLNLTEPKYINRPVEEKREFMMSSVAGATNSYAFVDEIKKDTLKIEWKVAYDQLELLDLYPANYFTDYIAYTSQDIFEKYPDTIQYDWSEVDYVQILDERGFPIAPALPHDHEGLLFVVHMTEYAVVQLKGHHDQFHKIDTKKPLDLLFYQNLSSGSYEFIAKPYEDAPERLWLKYPFDMYNHYAHFMTERYNRGVFLRYIYWVTL